jgi:FtsZ-interacting cell division protein ZipA
MPPIVPLVSTRAKIELLALVIFIACGIVFAHALRSERQARAAAEADVKIEQGKMKQADAQIAELQAADKIRDAQTTAQIQAAEAKAAAAKTPQQIAAYLSSQLKLAGAPAPISIETPTATPENPSPDAIAKIPAVDLPFLRDQVSKCQADALQASGSQADLTSCREQLKLAGQKLSAAEKERDDWKTAAKGGTWAKRIKSGAIKVGIGIAIGAAADRAAHK